MAEADRQRRLSVDNRLAELRATYGPECPQDEPGLACDPSWGPVGSLLARSDPGLYAQVLGQHRDMLALERSRRSADPPAPPPSAAVATTTWERRNDQW